MTMMIFKIQHLFALIFLSQSIAFAANSEIPYRNSLYYQHCRDGFLGSLSSRKILAIQLGVDTENCEVAAEKVYNATHIKITNTIFEWFEYIQEMPHLESLYLESIFNSRNQIKFKSLDPIFSMANKENLKSLTLINVGLKVSWKQLDLELIKKFKNFDRLEYLKLGDDQIDRFENLEQFLNLQATSTENLYDDPIAHLYFLYGSVPNLKQLVMPKNWNRRLFRYENCPSTTNSLGIRDFCKSLDYFFDVEQSLPKYPFDIPKKLQVSWMNDVKYVFFYQRHFPNQKLKVCEYEDSLANEPISCSFHTTKINDITKYSHEKLHKYYYKVYSCNVADENDCQPTATFFGPVSFPGGTYSPLSL